MPGLSEGDTLLAALRQGGVGVFRWRIGTDEIEWCETVEALFGQDGLAPGRADPLSFLAADSAAIEPPQLRAALAATLETGSPLRVEMPVNRAAREIWVEMRGGIEVDSSGGRYLSGTCRDVTASRRRDLELEGQRQRQQAVDALIAASLADTPLQAVLDRAVELAAVAFAVPLAKILRFSDSADHLDLAAGIGWKDGLVGHATVGIERQSQAGYTLLAAEPVIVRDFATETRFNGPALLHEHGVASGVSVIIPGEGAAERKRPFGVFGIHDRAIRDFTPCDAALLVTFGQIVAGAVRQRAIVEQQNLLLREMAHRSGNLLQVIASIAAQTFRAHVDRDEALRAFMSRLDALSRANHLIARGGWTPTRLGTLVQESLQPFVNRFGLSGRDILLPADLAFDIALILHELATNSIKYGTLARPGGDIALSWSIEAPADDALDAASVLELVWFDPAPLGNFGEGRGFGSRLKRSLVERKWRGTMTVETGSAYRFACRIPLPA